MSFAHPRTGAPEPYARVLGCPVVFGAAEHEITLADADLAAAGHPATRS
ncbi:AraC family transcriptional regulator ligand-binding domain-containing protein [Streptomyces sp. NPDC058611]